MAFRNAPIAAQQLTGGTITGNYVFTGGVTVAGSLDVTGTDVTTDAITVAGWTTWHPLTLGSKVSAHGAGFTTPAVRVCADGLAQLRGLLDTTGLAAGDPLATGLPAPADAAAHVLTAGTSAGPARLQLSAAGALVAIDPVAAGAQLSLDALAYDALVG